MSEVARTQPANCTNAEKKKSSSLSPLYILSEDVQKSSPGPAAEQEERQQKGQGQGQGIACNCKKSRCLKRYCECFAGGNYCDGCNCLNCFNNRAAEPARLQTIAAIVGREPNAFRAKIRNAAGDKQDTNYSHSTGCHCKKSAW